MRVAAALACWRSLLALRSLSRLTLNREPHRFSAATVADAAAAVACGWGRVAVAVELEVNVVDGHVDEDVVHAVVVVAGAAWQPTT